MLVDKAFLSQARLDIIRQGMIIYEALEASPIFSFPLFPSWGLPKVSSLQTKKLPLPCAPFAVTLSLEN